jgi:hypothetical protein
MRPPCNPRTSAARARALRRARRCTCLKVQLALDLKHGCVSLGVDHDAAALHQGGVQQLHLRRREGAGPPRGAARRGRRGAWGLLGGVWLRRLLVLGEAGACTCQAGLGQ